MAYSDKQRMYEKQEGYRQRNFDAVMQYLRSHPCVDCTEGDIVVLEFDHLPGLVKKFEIGRALTSTTRSLKSILDEIKKCEVVCANCHKRRTSKRRNTRRHQLQAPVA